MTSKDPHSHQADDELTDEQQEAVAGGEEYFDPRL